MSSPGLLVATSRLKDDTSLSSDTFNHWYQQIHIPDVLKAQDGPPMALHLTNADPAAKWQHLVVYRIPDTNWIGSDSMK